MVEVPDSGVHRREGYMYILSHRYHGAVNPPLKKFEMHLLSFPIKTGRQSSFHCIDILRWTPTPSAKYFSLTFTGLFCLVPVVPGSLNRI